VAFKEAQISKQVYPALWLSRHFHQQAKMPQAPPAQMAGRLSPEMAELLSQKIREMERSNAAENEKNTQAVKGRARVAAKGKLKEAKKIVQDAEMPSNEKVMKLWEKLQSESKEVETIANEASAKLSECCTIEKERASAQADLNRVVALKTKLEGLCRQLQQQSDQLLEERKWQTEMERRRRHELADEYQRTIEDVKTKMDMQANERARLAQENEDLRSRFKLFFEKYDGREKEIVDQQKNRESEVSILNKQLEEMAARYKEEATREAYAERDHTELTTTEQQLRQQLQLYSNKFTNFQEALARSDKILVQYKRQKCKLERKMETLQKENQELKARCDKRIATLTKDVEQVSKEKAALQDVCRGLQAERAKLLEASKG